MKGGGGLEQERRASSGSSREWGEFKCVDRQWNPPWKKETACKQRTSSGQKVLYGSREHFDWLGLHKDYL